MGNIVVLGLQMIPAIDLCMNTSYTSGLSMQNFPKFGRQRWQLVQFVRRQRKGFRPSPSALCSIHFKATDFARIDLVRYWYFLPKTTWDLPSPNHRCYWKFTSRCSVKETIQEEGMWLGQEPFLLRYCNLLSFLWKTMLCISSVYLWGNFRQYFHCYQVIK